jgi:hypothetical protein
LPERAVHLYARQLLSTYKIAVVTGADRYRITRLLRKAGIAVKPRGSAPAACRCGPIWERFPVPHRLTADLVAGLLYEGCGLSPHHIELLTGRPPPPLARKPALTAQLQSKRARVRKVVATVFRSGAAR